MTRKALLVCGIVGSLVYLAADVLGTLAWEGYHYTSQTISELSAIGAPSRPLFVPLGLAYAVLAIASERESGELRVATARCVSWQPCSSHTASPA